MRTINDRIDLKLTYEKIHDNKLLLSEGSYWNKWDDTKILVQAVEDFKAEIKNLADLIHYPKHWDTACYPTLESALYEIGCSECKK